MLLKYAIADEDTGNKVVLYFVYLAIKLAHDSAPNIGESVVGQNESFW
jgi:hypothetical protein